ncbi:MAG: phosphatidylglycerophosphatase A [Bdellovibrionia bacterium]
MKAGVYSARRKIVWENVRGAKSVSAFWIATALGAGLFPIAPGTMGTLVALPIAYYTNEWDLTARLLFWVGLTVLGSWAATVFDQMMKTGDNQNIVIDEVIGLGITAWTAGRDLKTLAVAFVLFRIFDVVKPPPVRQVDLWSKNQASPWAGGFGVIADDIVAGFQALGVILVLQYLHVI